MLSPPRTDTLQETRRGGRRQFSPFRSMQFLASWLFLPSFVAPVCGFHPPFLPPAPLLARGTPPTTLRTSSLRLGRIAASVSKTDEEWRSELSPEAFRVLREEGTEPPFSSELNAVKDDGTFVCGGCGAPLFVTGAKYDSGTGWPSFFEPVDDAAVSTSTDFKLVLPRTEVSCASCGGHLGHVFNDGPDPTGLRYCMNGVAMSFRADDDNPDLAKEIAARRAAAAPVRPTLGAVLPSAAFNGVIAVAFVGSFLSRYQQAAEVGAGLSSPLDFLPLVLGAVYVAIAARSLARLL